MCTTPSSRPALSTTITDVIFFSSINRSAAAASSVRGSVTGFFVMQSIAARSSTFCLRLASPAANRRR